uniref:Transmembrane protein 198 n=1 Tax=Hucho hucho TaxID=62062 RepID=A0A4W5MCZ4_9TELE
MTSTSWPQLLAFKLAPPPHDPGSPERILSCDEEIERRYEIVPSVACSMCCLFGIIYCFFGYRCFKAVMFLTGLMFGSVIIFLLCYKERVLDTQLSVEASVGIGLGIGTLCGLVTMLVRSVGLYMVGLLLGLLLGIASLVVMEEFHHPRTVWVPLGVLLGSGMLFAVLTLQWQRFFTTLSTSVFGSAVITVTVDYFIELFALVRNKFPVNCNILCLCHPYPHLQSHTSFTPRGVECSRVLRSPLQEACVTVCGCVCVGELEQLSSSLD